MKKETPELLKTSDGSYTLYLNHLDETYHSRHGAFAESTHVFIESGLEYWISLNYSKKSINVLEVGFGTGTNAILAAEFAKKHQVNINFFTTEPYPIKFGLIEKLAAESDWLQRSQEDFIALHQVDWEATVSINPYFNLHKTTTPIQDFKAPQKCDVVFFDAFAPRKDEALWTTQTLAHLSKQLNSPAILVCYSSQGAFRRNLKEVGFEVSKIPGPPGKREMTRAIWNTKNDQ
jgi:tRNA U34 5-methylaminomethyl-2-thiouridine-forming methyltransferase MnmC